MKDLQHVRMEQSLHELIKDDKFQEELIHEFNIDDNDPVSRTSSLLSTWFIRRGVPRGTAKNWSLLYVLGMQSVRNWAIRGSRERSEQGIAPETP